ncbi:hypothetical protein BJX66DRAFT_327670 [Aspergillus keveii]|uniref:Uncharacterized protein n=1 Tax=Aspergillus keveii TaxID=714993 RepID=A0ABR4FWN2_9EURO
MTGTQTELWLEDIAVVVAEEVDWFVGNSALVPLRDTSGSFENSWETWSAVLHGTRSDAEKASIMRDLLLVSDPKKSHKPFMAYWKLYESVFCAREGQETIIQVDNAAFASHADILECAKRLRASPTWTRDQLANTLSPNNSLSQGDRETAVESVIRVLFMLDCSLSKKYSENFEVDGYSPAYWEATEPFVSYVERAIPECNNVQPKSGFEPHKPRYMKALKAWKLRKRCGVQFIPTDNIMEHLLYDPEMGFVHVFHHTAYLKAHLRGSTSQPINQKASTSLGLGTLPPQLLLETLHSIQFILFPISNDKTRKSIRLLQRLVTKDGFDPNARLDEGWIRDGVAANFRYKYWNQRLEILYQLAKNPPPRNGFISWIERHTTERNALTVAIIGLFLSAFFGLLTCLIGGAQLAVAIMAWKDPKQPI